MKKHLLLLATLLFSSFIFSQTRGITYQAVIYNPESNNISLPGLPSQPVPFVNKAVCLRFDIIDINSNVTYSETHATTTDQFGMVNLIIGTGKKVGGSVATFGSIDWNRQANSLVVLLDGTANCSNFIQVSNQPFTATPFSLASGGSSSIVDASSTQKGQIQLAGDLGGTAAAPIVPGLALKADVTALNSGLATKANTSDVTTALALKAPLASPSLTGTPTAPTAPSGANTTQIATTEFVTSAVQDYVDLTSAQTISGSKSFSSNIRVGSTTPNASAALEVASTTQGFLPPLMTTVQRNSISNPAVGLVVYNITTNCLEWFNGSTWFNSCNNVSTVDSSNSFAVVSLYDCTSTLSGTLNAGTSITGVTKTIVANVTRIGSYSIATNTVNGITFSASGRFTTTGNQNIVMTASGTPIVAETSTFTLNTTPNCSFSALVTVGTPTVTSSTGRIWMDRNLGATRVATSATDTESFGDLYQWGRGTDGHQLRTSNVINTLSPSSQPGHGDFIYDPNSPYFGEWQSTPFITTLWQGVTGINNPCPSGFRLPTQSEFEAEAQTFTTPDAVGAFNSILKLPNASRRDFMGNPAYPGVSGYWTSTLFASDPTAFVYSNDVSIIPAPIVSNTIRSIGSSVRCIKD